MNSRILPISVLCAMFVPFLISCEDYDDDLDDNGISGSGNTTIEVRTVNQFHSISTSMVGDLFITQGSPQELRIVTHPLFLELLVTEVINGELSIRFDDRVNAFETLDIFITIPDIQSINFSGIGSVSGLNEFDLESLTVNHSGVGEITLSGKVTEFKANLSGVGALKAFDLTAVKSEIVLSGVGNVEITTLFELDIIINGLGSVSYKGSPQINSTISSEFGNVINAN